MSAEDPLGEAKPEGQNPSPPTGPTNPLSLCDHDNEVVVGRPEAPGAPTQTGESASGGVAQKPESVGEQLGPSQGQAGAGTGGQGEPPSPAVSSGEATAVESLEDIEERPMRSQSLLNLPRV